MVSETFQDLAPLCPPQSDPFFLLSALIIECWAAPIPASMENGLPLAIHSLLLAQWQPREQRRTIEPDADLPHRSLPASWDGCHFIRY